MVFSAADFSAASWASLALRAGESSSARMVEAMNRKTMVRSFVDMRFAFDCLGGYQTWVPDILCRIPGSRLSIVLRAFQQDFRAQAVIFGARCDFIRPFVKGFQLSHPRQVPFVGSQTGGPVFTQVQFGGKQALAPVVNLSTCLVVIILVHLDVGDHIPITGPSGPDGLACPFQTFFPLNLPFLPHLELGLGQIAALLKEKFQSFA